MSRQSQEACSRCGQFAIPYWRICAPARRDLMLCRANLCLRDWPRLYREASHAMSRPQRTLANISGCSFTVNKIFVNTVLTSGAQCNISHDNLYQHCDTDTEYSIDRK